MNYAAYFPTIRQLAEYEVWCNARSFDAAGVLTKDQLFHVFQFGFKTIHRTLFHTLDVFRHWSAFVAPNQVDLGWLPYEPSIPIAELKHHSDDLSKGFIDAIDAAHAADLLNHDRRLVQIFHLVTHGTHHRTQFITMLRLLQISPPFEAGDFAGWQRGGKLKTRSA